MVASTTRAPLAQVHAGLGRVAPRVAALPHITDLVSRFLDVSQSISPAYAAASGSVRLFQRVVSWRVGNALVSPIAQEYALSQALEAAIQADDLAMAQVIHALHAAPLDARSLKLAMAHGSFELVQWLVATRHDRVCTDAGGVQCLCRSCMELAAQQLGPKDLFRIASWLVVTGAISVSDGDDTTTCSLSMNAAMLKSAALVRWCDAQGLLSEPMMTRLMRDTLHQANAQSIEIVQYLLTRGFVPDREDDFVDALIAASCQPNQELLVELVLASPVSARWRHHFTYAALHPGSDKVLQWDIAYKTSRGFFGMGMATVLATTAGHLATMQWLVEAREERNLKVQLADRTETESLAILTWLDETGVGSWSSGTTMETAASNGHLAVVQWLDAHQCDEPSTRAMDLAATNGHLHVIDWLHTHRLDGCTHVAMNGAAENGHLDVVQWLYAHRTEGNVNVAMAFAAVSGEMAVVRWCLDHGGGCGRCVRTQLLAQPLAYNSKQHGAFDPRVLYPLQWLDQVVALGGDGASAVGCRGQCVATIADHAAVNLAAVALGVGDLNLLEYLHVHHTDLFAWPAHLHDAVRDTITWIGHVPAVQWLYARYPQSLDWQRLAEDASQRDQKDVTAWLQTLLSDPQRS